MSFFSQFLKSEMKFPTFEKVELGFFPSSQSFSTNLVSFLNAFSFFKKNLRPFSNTFHLILKRNIASLFDVGRWFSKILTEIPMMTHEKSSPDSQEYFSAISVIKREREISREWYLPCCVWQHWRDIVSLEHRFHCRKGRVWWVSVWKIKIRKREMSREWYSPYFLQ